MQQAITIEIPTEWLTGLPEGELTYRHIIKLGIHQLKVERAIEMYQDGVGSIGYISEQIGIEKHILIREMRLRNIEPDYSEDTLKEELS